LYPAWRSVPTPTPPNSSSDPELSSVSPGELHPGPTSTVGARLPAASPSAGKKCMLIGVWSKERTVASRALAPGADSARVAIPAIAAQVIRLTARPSPNRERRSFQIVR
jgi:hypothetical protein